MLTPRTRDHVEAAIEGLDRLRIPYAIAVTPDSECHIIAGSASGASRPASFLLLQASLLNLVQAQQPKHGPREAREGAPSRASSADVGRSASGLAASTSQAAAPMTSFPVIVLHPGEGTAGRWLQAAVYVISASFWILYVVARGVGVELRDIFLAAKSALQARIESRRGAPSSPLRPLSPSVPSAPLSPPSARWVPDRAPSHTQPHSQATHASSQAHGHGQLQPLLQSGKNRTILYPAIPRLAIESWALTSPAESFMSDTWLAAPLSDRTSDLRRPSLALSLPGCAAAGSGQLSSTAASAAKGATFRSQFNPADPSSPVSSASADEPDVPTASLTEFMPAGELSQASALEDSAAFVLAYAGGGPGPALGLTLQPSSTAAAPAQVRAPAAPVLDLPMARPQPQPEAQPQLETPECQVIRPRPNILFFSHAAGISGETTYTPMMHTGQDHWDREIAQPQSSDGEPSLSPALQGHVGFRDARDAGAAAAGLRESQASHSRSQSLSRRCSAAAGHHAVLSATPGPGESIFEVSDDSNGGSVCTPAPAAAARPVAAAAAHPGPQDQDDTATPTSRLYNMPHTPTLSVLAANGVPETPALYAARRPHAAAPAAVPAQPQDVPAPRLSFGYSDPSAADQAAGVDPRRDNFQNVVRSLLNTPPKRSPLLARSPSAMGMSNTRPFVPSGTSPVARTIVYETATHGSYPAPAPRAANRNARIRLYDGDSTEAAPAYTRASPTGGLPGSAAAAAAAASAAVAASIAAWTSAGAGSGPTSPAGSSAGKRWSPRNDDGAKTSTGAAKPVSLLSYVYGGDRISRSLQSKFRVVEKKPAAGPSGAKTGPAKPKASAGAAATAQLHRKGSLVGPFSPRDTAASAHGSIGAGSAASSRGAARVSVGVASARR